jgi:hypothetical protein
MEENKSVSGSKSKRSEVRAEDYRNLEKRIIKMLKEDMSVSEVKEELLKYAEG